MNVLITSAASPIGSRIAEGLAAEHTLRLTDDLARANGSDVIACSLDHDEETDALCKDIDAIVHICERDLGLNESEIVDAHSRKTYNLLIAASEAGVAHVVLVSSLALFDRSEADYEIDEQWAPPVSPELSQLRHHIGEFVCREFARSHAFPVTCLRFGEVVGDNDVKDDCVSESDLMSVITAAIDKRPGGWSVVHVVSAGAHFPTKKAQKVLDIALAGGAA